MTISVRNPAIRTTRLPARRPAHRSVFASVAAVSSRAIHPLTDVVQRFRQPPTTYRYGLTSFDRVFVDAAEPVADTDAVRRTDRRTGLAALGIGTAVVAVSSVAVAVLLVALVHVTRTFLG